MVGSVVWFLVGCGTTLKKPSQEQPIVPPLLSQSTTSSPSNAAAREGDNSHGNTPSKPQLHTVQKALSVLENRDNLLKENAIQLTNGFFESLQNRFSTFLVEKNNYLEKKGEDEFEEKCQPQIIETYDNYEKEAELLQALKERDQAESENTWLQTQLEDEKKKPAECATCCSVKTYVKKPPRQMRCRGSDRLVVVSLSTFSVGQPRTIRESFIEVFSEIKKKKSGKRFTLRTIQSGRQLSGTLLTCNSLRNLSMSGNNSIRGKIEMGMQFGASDLRAFDDLSKLNSIAQTIRRVLYITDNIRSNDPTEKQRRVPLAWRDAGVSLTVLTTGECSVWKYVNAKCTRWSGKRRFKKGLKAFLR
ncbi:MAG: hypothetical protein DRR19_29800 [Candidatus Parabeggiatoa sp. nov. 1]|nr:MAG: hypothetical protein DRR19_29800 [Gammaproteobacteria bacterium]